MINQFARAARQAVLDAARDAQHRAATEVTDEHLLLALLNQPSRRPRSCCGEPG